MNGYIFKFACVFLHAYDTLIFLQAVSIILSASLSSTPCDDGIPQPTCQSSEVRKLSLLSAILSLP